MADVQAVVWRQHKVADDWPDAGRDEVVWISVRALDGAWSVTDEYIGAAGVGSNQAGKYGRFGIWFAKARCVDMPVVCLVEGGRPSFTDGRHRFAWLRDHGLAALPIEVPPSEAENFSIRFGTNDRAGTILT